MTPPSTVPELSIVVSVPGASSALTECLAAITQQSSGIQAEILVVPARARDAELVTERFPRCILVEPGEARCEPELLGRGVPKAGGRIVAITSARCVPDSEWVEQLMRRQADYHSAVGGPVELAKDAGLGGAAAYFATCVAYMPPMREGLGNVSSANASYKRPAILGQMSTIEARGFWELDVNDQLRAEMRSLWRDPTLSVTFRGPGSLGAFCAERTAYGRGLGQLRAWRSTRGKRIYYIVRSPAMPFIYGWRVARHVIRQKRHGTTFVLAAPLLWWFLICQVIGEFRGLIEGARRMSYSRANTHS
jgi:hypothetical protein